MGIWFIIGLVGGIVLGIIAHRLIMKSYMIGYLRVDHTDYDIYHSPNFYMEVHDAETVMELKDGQYVVLKIKDENLDINSL